MGIIRETLSEPVRIIISRVLDVMKNTSGAEQVTELGWRYGGAEFQRVLDELKVQLEREGKGPIVQCVASRLFRGAGLANPTRRVILIPLNGVSAFAQDAVLEPGSLYYTDEEGLALYGLCVDVIHIVLGRNG